MLLLNIAGCMGLVGADVALLLSSLLNQVLFKHERFGIGHCRLGRCEVPPGLLPGRMAPHAPTSHIIIPSINNSISTEEADSCSEMEGSDNVTADAKVDGQLSKTLSCHE